MNRKKGRRRLRLLRAVALRRRMPGKKTKTDVQRISRYERDVLVVMPVNRETNFVFWEVSRKTLDDGMSRAGGDRAELQVRIYDRGAGRRICTFDAGRRLGSHYVASRVLRGPLVAEIGIKYGRLFNTLLRSSPADVLHRAEENSMEAAPAK